MPPLWFFVYSCVGQAAEFANGGSLNTDGGRLKLCPRRLVHKWHELVRKSGHRAADANAADVRTATESCHPPTLRNVAIDNRSPAAEFDQASRRAVLARKFALFVITAAIASFVNSLSEQPRRSACFIERNHRRKTSSDIKQVKHGFHEVVR